MKVCAIIYFLLLFKVGFTNYIETKITIVNNYPTISLDIGEQKARKLLLSLYTPTIFTFPYQSQIDHYDNSQSKTYTATGIIAEMPSIKPTEDDYQVRISNEIFLINGTLKLNLTFGDIAKEDFSCPI